VVECFTERREIHVATSATDKTASKAFTFDRVFGPETSQSQVYEEVVHPLIEEVIMGYNCTIFAYVTPLSPSLSLPVCGLGNPHLLFLCLGTARLVLGRRTPWRAATGTMMRSLLRITLVLGSSPVCSTIYSGYCLQDPLR